MNDETCTNKQPLEPLYQPIETDSANLKVDSAAYLEQSRTRAEVSSQRDEREVSRRSLLRLNPGQQDAEQRVSEHFGYL